MARSLGWAVNRLRCMSAAEILHRVTVKAQNSVEARGFGLALRVPQPLHLQTHCWIPEPDARVLGGDYVGRAERVLAGRFDVFALRDLDLGFPPDWSRDPKTGRRAPLAFGKTLNYRDESVVGDIKYLWEINRHRELLWLAQAWALTGETRFLDGVGRLLGSWLTACPYPRGVNWTSSLEHAVRLIHWSAVWSLIGGAESSLFADAEGQALRRDWLDSIYQHMHFIRSHFSRYSSANNHLIGEYAGLFIGAAVWPVWEESPDWVRRAAAGLEEEIQRQTFDDGFNREQAIWYHHEVAELFLICALVARHTGREFSKAYWGRIEDMLDVIALLMDRCGNLPAIGDADDAVYLEFGVERDVYRSLLSSGAVLFERGDYKARLAAFDERSCWLLGASARDRFETLDALPSTPAMPSALPDAGYHVLGSDRGDSREIQIILDSGCLGYLSIAAHGHADALSMHLSAGGYPMLIDPGTYAYHTEEKWRIYFRSTAAHNTVTVDGQDQSVQAGNFMWHRHAQSRCLSCTREGRTQLWEAETLGYERLADPLRHRRRVAFDETASSLTVSDHLHCAGEHAIALHWHLHPDCEVSLNAGVAEIRRAGARLRIGMRDPAWTPELVRGQEEPPLGWFSERFDEKVPAPTLRFSGEISGTTTLVTHIEITWIE